MLYKGGLRVSIHVGCEVHLPRCGIHTEWANIKITPSYSSKLLGANTKPEEVGALIMEVALIIKSIPYPRDPLSVAHTPATTSFLHTTSSSSPAQLKPVKPTSSSE